jgi:hypothetical protein
MTFTPSTVPLRATHLSRRSKNHRTQHLSLHCQTAAHCRTAYHSCCSVQQPPSRTRLQRLASLPIPSTTNHCKESTIHRSFTERIAPITNHVAQIQCVTPPFWDIRETRTWVLKTNILNGSVHLQHINLNLLPYYTFLLIILYNTLNSPRETYYTK